MWKSTHESGEFLGGDATAFLGGDATMLRDPHRHAVEQAKRRLRAGHDSAVDAPRQIDLCTGEYLLPHERPRLVEQEQEAGRRRFADRGEGLFHLATLVESQRPVHKSNSESGALTSRRWAGGHDSAVARRRDNLIYALRADMSKISSSMDCVGIAVPFFFSIASQSSFAASHETPRTYAKM